MQRAHLRRLVANLLGKAQPLLQPLERRLTLAVLRGQRGQVQIVQVITGDTQQIVLARDVHSPSKLLEVYPPIIPAGDLVRKWKGRVEGEEGLVVRVSYRQIFNVWTSLRLSHSVTQSLKHSVTK